MKTQRKISRRTFLNRSLIGATTILLNPLGFANGKYPNQRLHIRMIGHGHIDPIWFWRWSEGVSIVHSTFRSALDRIKEFPDMVFTSSSAQFYQWIANSDPKMLAEIKEKIKEGKWEIVGGWWVEPDVNIPCGESFVRQGLYGQLLFRKLLDVQATTAFNPDGFGHTNVIPQIVKKQGMENYVFMRPNPNEKKLPSDLFWWESPDHSKVMAYRIQNAYNTPPQRGLRYRVDDILAIAEKQPMNSFMVFYGVGDHGGGPTKINLQSIEEMRKDKELPEIVYGRTDSFFNEMRSISDLKLPIVSEDLQHHAVGCYTADWKIKKGNRSSETALISSEKICAIGEIMWSCHYPMEQLTAAWHKLLFLQFHDSLAGTSLPSHTKDAADGFAYICNVANEAAVFALQKLEWQIAAEDPDMNYLIVFNPHAWVIESYLRYDFYGWSYLPESTAVIDADGNSYPHQWGIAEAQANFTDNPSGRRREVLFKARIPPMGYTQIKIGAGKPMIIENSAKAEDNLLENMFYRILFAEDGTWNIWDKETGQAVFDENKGGARAVVMEDKSDTWSHNVTKYTKEIGSFQNAQWKVLENGPLRAVIRITSQYGDSRLSIDWKLYADSRKIEASVILDWHERFKILKFSFPINVSAPRAFYEMPYGFIERDTEGLENPGQRWVDVSGKQGDKVYGFTVINDSKYGYDVNKNDLHISVARAAIYAHHKPIIPEDEKEYIWMDQGIQEFRMLLLPHKGDWKEVNIPRISEEFIFEPMIICQGIHPGDKPKSGSFINIDMPNINLTAIKKAEIGDEIIIRCVELHGKATAFTFDFMNGFFTWKDHINANEIKTFRCDLVSKNIREVNLLEE